jgi:hypothetical protein
VLFDLGLPLSTLGLVRKEINFDIAGKKEKRRETHYIKFNIHKRKRISYSGKAQIFQSSSTKYLYQKSNKV